MAFTNPYNSIGTHTRRTKMFARKQSGFSMVELLTVIAIIALLAAIIFPIMSSAKESARRTQCISNMGNIFQAVQLFKSDQHRYPEFIVGPVKWKLDSSGNIVEPYPLSDSTGTLENGTLVSLYPEYIKSSSDVKCPLSRAKSNEVAPDPMYTYLNTLDFSLSNPPMRRIGELNKPSAPEEYSSPAYYLYVASTYDIQMPKGSTEYQANYAPIWTNEDAASVTNKYSDVNEREAQLAVISRQLRWKEPPSDTIITRCSLHRDAAGDGTPSNGSNDIVLFLDGSTKLVPSKTVFDAGWTNVWAEIYPSSGH